MLFISACFPEPCIEWFEYNLQRELDSDPSTCPLHSLHSAYQKCRGCTKTGNGEIKNGNGEMRKWGMENKSVAARGSAVTRKQWQRQRIGEGKCASQANPSRAQLELTYTAPNHFRSKIHSCSLA